MIKQQPRRQHIGKGVILTTFLPILMIMNYFSSCIIIDRASQGVSRLAGHVPFLIQRGKVAG